MRFPDKFGTELGGRSFEDIFQNCPKWIAFVDTSWTDKCTGLFKEFQKYVTSKLKIPSVRREHELRCREYVKTIERENLPKYLVKYL